MANLATSMTGSSAALTVAEGVTGVLVRQKEAAIVQDISLAYRSSNDSMSVGELLLFVLCSNILNTDFTKTVFILEVMIVSATC